MIFSSRPPPMILVIHGDGGGEAYVHYLATAGFRVSSASRMPTAEIVERTLEARPDLIVLDYECDSETVERLKRDPRTAAIPVIALAELPGRPDPPVPWIAMQQDIDPESAVK